MMHELLSVQEKTFCIEINKNTIKYDLKTSDFAAKTIKIFLLFVGKTCQRGDEDDVNSLTRTCTNIIFGKFLN